MQFDLDQRTAALSVGEFSDFSTGPRESGGGSAGVWRAQLGTHWHNELRARATAEHAAAAEFEVAIAGKIFHRGWTLSLTGRIDQLIRRDAAITLREIKTVTRPIPADEAELRRDYPEYFIQLAAYAALTRLQPGSGPARTELCFVEAASGLAQTIALTPADDGLFRAQLERVAAFLDLRLRARERLRGLRFRPAFAAPRPGQETTQAELTALFERRPLVLFEAPTGFGKTGVLLEFALGQLRSGHFDRALYLTSKSTGQIQVVHTL
ncbi:MAG: PD-(D/E)XK nuclease family protein, partial [Opitutaceae bacterium]|nr:PD-(D/E)XK nuclease family protein [Opitutaceae bacterium]